MQEEKKEYTAPKMEVVTIESAPRLLSDSCDSSDAPCVYGGGG